jgi:hypothetical protein
MAVAAGRTTRKKSAPKTSPKIDVEFEFEKDTKNTRRFKEVVEGDAVPVIGTLYVQQSAFKGEIPERVTVTIHPA